MAQGPSFRGDRKIGGAIDRWLAAGLIDASTADSLRSHEAQSRPPGTGRLTRLAFGFGGLLLAAGIFLFIAANWQQLSPWWRFSLVLGVVAILHLGAAYASRSSDSLARTLHAVGTAACGAGIFLAGQIFNLQEHWPNALLLWALGAAIALVLLRDWPQTVWLALLVPAWLSAEWYSRVPWEVLFASKAAQIVVPYGMVVLSGAYLSATGRDQDSPWRRVLELLGAIGLLFSVISLTGAGFERPEGGQPPPLTWLVIAWTLAAGLPLLLAGLFRRQEAWPVAVLALLAGVVVLLDVAQTWQRLAIYFTYALGSVGLVIWGMKDRRSLRVNLGVLGFVLTVLAFYFSSLYDMLGRAFGLIGLGLLCIGGGWLAERGRRRLLARLGGEAT